MFLPCIWIHQIILYVWDIVSAVEQAPFSFPAAKGIDDGGARHLHDGRKTH